MLDHMLITRNLLAHYRAQKSKRDRWPNGFSDLVVQDISDTIEIRQWTLHRTLFEVACRVRVPSQGIRD
jgi:hypothetical protein